MSLIPVIVVTGFLGSGKTTLLSNWLSSGALTDTAVIINEFGEIGLDHVLMEHSQDNLIELQNGCICCTIRTDLRNTLVSLAERVAAGAIKPFRRVIIETTGLADPVPIIHTLIMSSNLCNIYTIAGVVTVIDAATAWGTLQTHLEAVKQAALADILIVSKMDMVSSGQFNAVRKQLTAVNPGAPMVISRNGHVPVDVVVNLNGYDPFKKSKVAGDWLNHEAFQGHEHHRHDVNRHSQGIQAFALVDDRAVEPLALDYFLRMLPVMAGPDLLRMKAIVKVKTHDRPAIVQCVQHIIPPVRLLDAWSDNDHRTRMVFITRNIPRERIEQFFGYLLTAQENATRPPVNLPDERASPV